MLLLMRPNRQAAARD